VDQERLKLTSLKRKDKTQKFYDCKNPTGTSKSNPHQKRQYVEGASCHKKELLIKHRRGKQNTVNNKSNPEKITQKQHEITDFVFNVPQNKILSEFTDQQLSKELQNRSDSPVTGAFLRQHPFLGLYPSLALPLLAGLPNLPNSLLGSPKLDLDSFRLGLLTAFEQNRNQEQLPRSFLNKTSSLDSLFPNDVTQSQNVPNEGGRSSHDEKTERSQTNPLPSETKSSPKPIQSAEDTKSDSVQTKSGEHINSQINFPGPVLMIPFPIPIPIPIPIFHQPNGFLSHPNSIDPSENTLLNSTGLTFDKKDHTCSEKFEAKPQDSDSNDKVLFHPNQDAVLTKYNEHEALTETNAVLDLSTCTQKCDRNSNKNEIEQG